MPISMTRVCEETADHLPTCHHNLKTASRRRYFMFWIILAKPSCGQASVASSQSACITVRVGRAVRSAASYFAPQSE